MAPAGAGKTFLALHFILNVLNDDDGAHILYTARNLALALLLVKWVASRARVGMRLSARKLGKLLPRIHLLCEPFDQGPRVANLNDTAFELTEVQQREDYDLVVIDEAHHIWRNDSSDVARATVESVACCCPMHRKDSILISNTQICSQWS